MAPWGWCGSEHARHEQARREATATGATDSRATAEGEGEAGEVGQRGLAESLGVPQVTHDDPPTRVQVEMYTLPRGRDAVGDYIASLARGRRQKAVLLSTPADREVRRMNAYLQESRHARAADRQQIAMLRAGMREAKARRRARTPAYRAAFLTPGA